MKKIIALAVLIIVGTTVFYAHKARTPYLVTDPHIGSIVRLVDNGHTVCTGTVVSPTVIITAAHCVIMEGLFGGIIRSEPYEIRGDDNAPTGVLGTPYGVRVQLDQALLTGDFHVFKARKFMTDIKELNTYRSDNVTLLACGYPMGGPLYCTKMEFKELYQFMWATEGLLLPGMSGGPVMLDDGTVVAVNVAVAGDKSIVSPIYNIDLQFRKEK